jgi:hypothetical protein
MVAPLDGIKAFHNAFRKDMAAIDAAADTAARGKGNLDLLLKRYTFFNEVLVWHAAGEEEFIFPALEQVAPLVAEAYEKDHRGLDTLYEILDKAVKAADKLAIARAASALEFHLRFHLYKEDTHLYRIFDERIPVPEQAAITGKLSQKIPQPRFPEVVTWLYTLIGPNDRENVTRILQMALPAPAFVGVKKLIQSTLGDDWADLVRRIPELK